MPSVLCVICQLRKCQNHVRVSRKRTNEQIDNGSRGYNGNRCRARRTGRRCQDKGWRRERAGRFEHRSWRRCNASSRLDRYRGRSGGTRRRVAIGVAGCRQDAIAPSCSSSDHTDREAGFVHRDDFALRIPHPHVSAPSRFHVVESARILHSCEEYDSDQQKCITSTTVIQTVHLGARYAAADPSLKMRSTAMI